MTNQELVQTYVQTLIIQFSDPNNQPKAIATITLMANEAIANQVVGQVGDGFALSTLYGQTIAQGVQLDLVAQFVGAVRILPGYSPTIVYFGQQDTTGSYSASIGGYGDVTTGVPPTDYWNSTNHTVGSYTLSDAQMLQLILYLAAVNNAEYTVAAIDAILFSFFGMYVTVSEPSAMAIEYTQNSSDPGTLFGIVEYLDAFPHPMGVELGTTP